MWTKKRFLFADPHWGDENILRFENRPFANVQAMDTALIANWNNVVSCEDEVYLLGDFGAAGCEKEILDQLNGTKFLVKGNHDLATNNQYREFGFTEVYDHPIILDEFWILSHEPLYVSENLPYANIFGHVHASPIYKTFSSHHYCVSAERTNYTPISFDEIVCKLASIVRTNNTGAPHI